MCTRKRAYDSVGHALGTAVHRVSTGEARALRAYRCPYCRLWHLTHKRALA